MTQKLILTLGAFGEAVAAKSAAPGDRIQPFPLDDFDQLDAILDGVDFAAIAAWRPYADAFLAMDAACHRSATPWTAAVLTGTRLSVGPLVHPGMPGCHACFVKRVGTHSRAPGRDLVLETFYRRNPAAGPLGFTAPMAALAAYGLGEDAVAGASAAGRLRIIDVLTGAVTMTEVLAVHGCPKCFPDRQQAQPGARFVRDLVPALQELMT
jgi:bacteriocin biosynthesis cyclodehydratase domain-containing protein